MTTKAFMPVLSSFFDDFVTKDLGNFPSSYPKSWANIPSVNVKETETDFQIELAAPGLKKEDFKIKLQENILTIGSEKEENTEEKNNGYVRKEFNYSSFSRSFRLPDQKIEMENIVAKYNDGILTVSVPKVAENVAKKFKEISVQ